MYLPASSFLYLPLLASSFLYLSLLASSFLYLPLLASSFLYLPLPFSTCLCLPLPLKFNIDHRQSDNQTNRHRDTLNICSSRAASSQLKSVFAPLKCQTLVKIFKIQKLVKNGKVWDPPFIPLKFLIFFAAQQNPM